MEVLMERYLFGRPIKGYPNRKSISESREGHTLIV